MITEDYVSFETAKLLKEKGFDDFTCHSYFYKNGDIEEETRYEGDFGRPTLQMAMKWLREVHNLCIFLIPSYVDENFHNGVALYPICNGEWEWCASKNDGSMATFGYNVNNKYCETYEKACEAVIKYCLENLI